MRYILWLIGICPGLLTAELINQPVVNIYLEPKEDTQVESQSIYGNAVEVLEERNGWSKVRNVDGAEGWLLSSCLTSNASYENKSHLRPIKSFFANIYRVKDTTPYPPLLTIPYGAKIKLDEGIDKGERWVSVELISGESAWIQRGDVDFTPQFKTLEETISFSKKFLGLPYVWRGGSTYGFSCSGFVQMLFREMGFQLPGNSKLQAECDLFTFVAEEDLRPGDLVFFGKTDIIHVGLYLGDDAFIHSGITEVPTVLISNMKNKQYHFLTARRINPLMIETYRMNFR